jgi:hypothetical protein
MAPPLLQSRNEQATDRLPQLLSIEDLEKAIIKPVLAE